MILRFLLRRAVAVAACALAAASASPVRAAFTEQGATILGAVNYDARSASLADIDRDGDLDLLFQGGSGAQKLWRNNFIGGGTVTFTDISSQLPSGLGLSWSAAWGDYDGDRRIDVFVGQTNSGATGDLLRNTGSGFSNASSTSGLINDPGFHQNLAWVDVDNDRDLDLLMGMEGPEKHEIYLQQPNGSFTAVGASVGFQADVGTRSYGMAVGDSDGDGDLDIYISTCDGTNDIRNNFYQNMLVETGSLGFVDVADSNGTQYTLNSYGSEFVDFDDDGDLDLYVTGAGANPTKIFRNDGGNMFTDVDTVLGHPLLSNTGGDFNGARAVDYDNDGDLDLYFHDNEARAGKNIARALYRNDGNWQFTDVTAAQGLSATNQRGYDSAWGDIDRDGDMDLIAATGSSWNERIFVNDAASNGNNWLQVRLNGLNDNSTGIGATLYATINAGTPQERTLRREANTNAGTFNQSDLPVHFGLGSATFLDELTIRWPDGTMQRIPNVALDHYAAFNYPGDFTGNGVIDGADLAQWFIQFSGAGTGGADYDGVIDGADLLAWQRGLGGGATISAVPEPALAALLTTLSGVALGQRRRWRSPAAER